MNDIMFSVLIQAPYTPFLTELMYQNLKTLIDPASVQDKDASSIPYLIIVLRASSCAPYLLKYESIFMFTKSNAEILK